MNSLDEIFGGYLYAIINIEKGGATLYTYIIAQEILNGREVELEWPDMDLDLTMDMDITL